MRVLVWQIFGNVHVFAAETPMHFFKLHAELVKWTEGWGEEAVLEKLFNDMGRCTTQLQCERLFMAYARHHVGTHETFEVFEFSYLENA